MGWEGGVGRGVGLEGAGGDTGGEGLWEAHSQGWGLARSELCYPNCGSGLELLVWTQQGNSCPFFCLKVLLR